MQIDYLQRTQDLDNLITVIHNLSQMKTGSTFAINGRWGMWENISSESS